jgi:hypothetical protein
MNTVPLWFKRAANNDQPRTHALVIGVSAYRHPPFGLSDLPGSAISALRFAEWLCKDEGGYRPPDAPLGSIRLLLAPTEGELRRPRDPLIALPDRDTVIDALYQWMADCCSDSRNVAILYAAGHGFRETLEGALVLMHDAGKSKKMFDEALDIEGVRDALRGETAPRRQYYFVDACREVAGKLKGIERPISGGITPHASEGERLPAPVYYAAAADKKAYQDITGSIFIDALLLCLRLDAVQRRDKSTNEWVVRANRLQEALDNRVPELAAQGNKDQEAGTGGTANSQIFTRADHPMVPFKLDVVPPDGRKGARARVFSELLNKEAVEETPIPIHSRQVPAGMWSVRLRFELSPPKYHPYDAAPIYVDPPRYDEPLPLRRPP